MLNIGEQKSKGKTPQGLAAIKWADNLGQANIKKEKPSIEELLRPSEDDVYPLSIHYTEP